MPVHLTPEEHGLLSNLRLKRRARRQHLKPKSDVSQNASPNTSMGNRVADSVASVVGSWRFIIIQSVLLMIWIILNVIGWIKAWDPYPFVLLNLALSFQAAFTAPIIMMSQNRQSDIDRVKAAEDFDVNTKAELEIEALHQKIDLMRETEILQLTQLVGKLCAHLDSEKAN